MSASPSTPQCIPLPHPGARRGFSVFLWTSLIAAAASPLVSLGADFLNYSTFFDLARSLSLEEVLAERYEPLFSLASMALSRLIPSDAWVFGLLMVGSLAMKIMFIDRIAATRSAAGIVLIWYCARFFPLHELTQIRIALALGIWLMALTVRDRRIALLLGVASVFTHYSMILMLPVLWGWQAMLHAPARYARLELKVMMGAGIITLVLILALQPLLEAMSLAFSILDIYSSEGFGEDRVNLFSLGIVVDLGLLALGWYCSYKDMRARFWLAMLSLSLGTFYALADFPVLAHRVRELMSICWLPYLLVAFAGGARSRQHAWATVLINVLVYVYINFFGTNALFSIADY